MELARGSDETDPRRSPAHADGRRHACVGQNRAAADTARIAGRVLLAVERSRGVDGTKHLVDDVVIGDWRPAVER